MGDRYNIDRPNQPTIKKTKCKEAIQFNFIYKAQNQNRVILRHLTL